MPMVDGKTLIGWGAVRELPWHFAGLFASREEAQLRSDALGDGYVARYGERDETSDTFAWGQPAQCRVSIAATLEALPTAKTQVGRLEAVATWINVRIARTLRGSKS